MPWDLGANLLAGVRTGLDIGQTQQANALRQQVAAQGQYQMYRQAVKDAETRAGKIIQAALPMLDTTDEASLQRSWASIMPGVFQQLDSQGLTQFEPVALQLRGLHEGVMSGRDTTTMLNAIRRMPGLEPKYLTVARGGRIIEPGTGRVVAEGMPPKAEGQFKVGETREIKDVTDVITQEWTGTGWKDISRGPRFKPDSTKPKPKDSFKIEQSLRKEFGSESKNFISLKNSYNTILANADAKTAAGDMGLIFAIMKMFDPASVVRESEYATAQEAASVIERAKAAAARVATGEKLSDEQRNDFVATAGRVYEISQKDFSRTKKRYSRLAEAHGLKPENVVFEYAAETPTAESYLQKYGGTE